MYEAVIIKAKTCSDSDFNSDNKLVVNGLECNVQNLGAYSDINSQFERECYGYAQCKIKMYSDYSDLDPEDPEQSQQCISEAIQNNYYIGIAAHCKDMYIDIPFGSGDWAKSDAAYVITTFDILICLFYLIMIIIFKIGSKADAIDSAREQVTADIYTVKISGFPRYKHSHEIELDLWEKLENTLSGYPALYRDLNKVDIIDV